MAHPIHVGDPENSRFVTTLFLIVFAIAVLLFLRLIFVYVTAIVLALVLVTLFWPMHKRIAQRVKQKELAGSISTAAVVAFVLVPVGGLVAMLSAQAVGVYNQVTSERGLVETLGVHLAPDGPLLVWARDKAAQFGFTIDPERVRELINQLAAGAGSFAYENVGGVATNTFNVLVEFSMMVIVLFALFAEGARLKSYVLDLSPLPDDQEEMLAERFVAISKGVFVGNGVGSLLQGLFGGIGFYLFGLGNGILWGAAIAFFAFLPIVGAGVIVVPATIWVFLQGDPMLGVGFLVYHLVYIAIFEYGLKTKFIGGSSKMNGVLVFVGIVAGLGIFGILGLFYGPLVLMMFLTLADIYKAHYRNDLMNVHSPWAHADAHTWMEHDRATIFDDSPYADPAASLEDIKAIAPDVQEEPAGSDGNNNEDDEPLKSDV